MRDVILTIITPIYNRASIVINLYNSLKEQDSKNFEWLIVDDGSRDNISEVVLGFITENAIPIKYIQKKNGGKHTAVNLALNYVNTELVFIVDSDDSLSKEAVSTILTYHEKYKGRDDLCGYSFLRKFPDGKINGRLFEPDELIGTYIEVRVNKNDMMADKAEVFYTSCLKKFPFPEIVNEHFLGEDTVWVKMATQYSMVHINKAIYVGNYLEDGLTKNRRKNNIAAPIGCTLRAQEFMRKEINFKMRAKATIQYITYSLFAKKSICDILKPDRNKWMVYWLLPIGYILYLKWKRQDYA